MKCLFCGKELAIFKRLSGSEFCSDAHRKQYQQEYNQLALSRLLHAQTPSSLTVARPETALVPGSGAPAVKPEPVQPAAPRATAAPVAVAPAAIADRDPRGAPIPLPGVNKPAPRATPMAATTPLRVHETPTARVVPEATHQTARAASAGVLEPELAAPVPAATVAEMAAEVVADATNPAPPAPAEPKLAAPAPIAGLIDSKPPAKQTEAASIAAVAPEVLETATRPEHPTAPMEPLTVDLRNAGLVPFASGLVPPRSGTMSIESRPEARDFARPTPTIDTVFTILMPVLRSASHPLPIKADARIPGPANPWTWEATSFTQTTQVATGRIVECDLLTTGIDALNQHAPVASTEVESRAIAGSSTESIAEPNATGHTDPDEAQEATQITPQGENAPRPPATTPLPIAAHTAAPGKARVVQVFQAALSGSARIEVPRHDPLPLRSVMAVPAVATTSVKVTTPSALKAVTPAVSVETSKQTAVPETGSRANAIQPVLAAHSSSTTVDKPNQQSPNTAAGTNGRDRKPSEQRDNTAEPRNGANPVGAPSVKPASDGMPTPKTPKAGEVPPKGDPSVTRPTVELKVGTHPPPPAGSSFVDPELNLPELHVGGSRLPNRTALLAASGVAAVLISALIVFSLKGSNSATTIAQPPRVNATSIGTGPDWIENYSPDPLYPRTISVLRSTSSYKDYRIEMEAQIDSKALGWVFRAKDPRNFQVGKIEVQRNGTEVNPFLVHFAVINGVPETRKQVPLAISVSPSTVYRVRFEVTGNRFTAYVQDRRVDEWSDARLVTGGAGLYSESGERAILESAFDVTLAEKAN